MERFAILRFGDAEVRTISEHQKIIRERGQTWWGWWKKTTEPFPSSTLHFLKDGAGRNPIRIGLVKRKEEEELFVATCRGVAIANGAASMASPEPALTPEYYRAQECPAWFAFTHIEEASRSAFVREFGSVPASDPTFYEVTWGETNGFDIHPKPDWTMGVVGTKGDAILHLSDLHFGGDHGFPLHAANEGASVHRQTLVEIISDRVTRELNIQVGVVVVSGDLITRGDANAYSDARSFLEDLLTRLQLGPEHCVIVPGNHDLWTLDIEHLTRDYRHERPYRAFVDAFFQRKLQELERVRRYRTRSGVELVFIELNSARLRSEVLKEYGYVSKHRYAGLLKYVSEVLSQDSSGSSCLKFAVLHHHLMPVGSVVVPDDRKPVSLCLDAGELIDELQSYGVQFVLHGHEHVPFVGTVGRVRPNRQNQTAAQRLFVLASGSSGASRDRLPPEPGQNTFGIYTPSRDSLDVSIEQYDQARSPQTLLHVSLPLA